MVFQLTFCTHLSSLPCVLYVSPVPFSLRTSKNIWTGFLRLTERHFQVPDPNLMEFECVISRSNVFIQFLPELSKILWQDIRQLSLLPMLNIRVRVRDGAMPPALTWNEVRSMRWVRRLITRHVFTEKLNFKGRCYEIFSARF